ncbi:hypothetical protein Y1Q_0024637 [Alligator mississippiensis]|uniref:Uncharacterized protein n=1 Tax=Alligator mississippiensis TaxID=8496 RepID=A0A151NB70_ALLMI|nr:hypothetical protein Y1Q_0024637 [Alligator mississippiensis]
MDYTSLMVELILKREKDGNQEQLANSKITLKQPFLCFITLTGTLHTEDQDSLQTMYRMKKEFSYDNAMIKQDAVSS